eukprot:10324285-Lingulodinium_polyedra.AAC.1
MFAGLRANAEAGQVHLGSAIKELVFTQHAVAWVVCTLAETQDLLTRARRASKEKELAVQEE